MHFSVVLLAVQWEARQIQSFPLFFLFFWLNTKKRNFITDA